MPARDQTSSLLARQHIQYEDPFAKFAQYANQKGAQIRADERYADEQARQKMLDDRATTLFEQQQAERNAQIAATKMADRDIAGAHAVSKGELADKFALADTAKATENYKSMQEQLSKNPSLLAKYNEALKGEDFKQIDTAGNLVDMNAKDRATLERLTMEEVLGVKGGYRGEEAAKMAYGYKTPEQVTREQNDLASSLAAMQQADVANAAGSTKGSAGYTKKVPMGSEVVRPAVATVPAQTTATWVNQHADVRNQLLGREAPYKEGPMTSVRMHKLENIEKERERILRGGANYTGIPGDSTRRLKPEAVQKLRLLEENRKEVMRDKSVPASIKGVTTRAAWEKAPEDTQRISMVTDAILRLPVPQDKKEEILRDFGSAITGKAGQKEVRRTIYGEQYVPGTAGVTTDNMYKGKVVTTVSGQPMDLTGVSQAKRGVIVEAQKAFRDQVENTFGLEDILAKSANTMMRDVAAKHGVPLQSLQADKILDQARLSGKMTPGQERTLKLMEGEMAAAIEQYKMDRDQANADRDFGLRVKQLNQDMEKFRMSFAQDERQHRENLQLKKLEATARGKVDMSNLLVKNPTTGDMMFMPKTAILPKGYQIVDQTPDATKSKNYDISGLGNQKKVANWIAAAKKRGFKDHEINAALSQAPKGDDAIDFGSPDLDITYADSYLNSLDR